MQRPIFKTEAFFINFSREIFFRTKYVHNPELFNLLRELRETGRMNTTKWVF